MKRVLALDPGGTTGWALWQETAANGMVERFGNGWSVGHIGPDEHHLHLYDMLGLLQTGDFTVVCESFEFRQHDGNRTGIELISKEYIGIVKLFRAERMGGLTNNSVVFQTAAQAKGFIPDKARAGLEANAKLKALDLHFKGMKHANDAMRHLIYYLVNSQGRSDLVKPWRDLV